MVRLSLSNQLPWQPSPSHFPTTTTTTIPQPLSLSLYLSFLWQYVISIMGVEYYSVLIKASDNKASVIRTPALVQINDTGPRVIGHMVLDGSQESLCRLVSLTLLMALLRQMRHEGWTVDTAKSHWELQLYENNPEVVYIHT